MPRFRIHRLKESAFQQFRWAPHTSGACQVKAKDYEPAGEVEATSVYDAWSVLRTSDRSLRVGDLLESDDGRLYVCKYVGFEDASWLMPEPKPVSGPAPAEAELPKPV
ncbi:MAG: hypothetical protein ACM3ZB_15165 [bacterium]|jgi:hypothetical protein